MPIKLTYEHVFNYIKEKGYKLLSTEYTSNKKLLDIKCGVCQKIYQQNFDRFKGGYYHPLCTHNRIDNLKQYMKVTILKPIECAICKITFQPSHSNTKLCSILCSHALWRTDEYRQNAIKNGQKAGKISAQHQNKRSQNEIYFSKLCEEYFTITTNETFFEGWDADVIIHSDKIAILWNGIWHYKQISKTQSLKQVQARDKVKTSIIEKKGYAPFVIIDMGKYDKQFVEQEFAIFLLMRMATKIME